MDEKTKKELEEAVQIMKDFAEDRGIPRNIVSAVNKALSKLDKKNPGAVDCSMAIYLLDDISNDINMPSYARTSVWTAISKLESVKEKIKEIE